MALMASLRLFRFSFHILWGLLRVLLVFPFLSKSAQRQQKQRWSRQLIATLGVELEIQGELPQGNLLIVANHVSWLIFT